MNVECARCMAIMKFEEEAGGNRVRDARCSYMKR
jgi:hypothetical protein